MDERINKIIDRLLDDCVMDDNTTTESSDYNYPDLTSKDLLTITQNFLEFKYPKQTRTTTKEAGKDAPTIKY